MKQLPGNIFSGRQGKALLLGAFLFSLAGCGGGGQTSESSSKEATSDSSSISSSESSQAPEIKNYDMVDGVKNDQGLSYEIFVPAFADSDGNGVGDFKGIAQKADYLASMGVNRVWLMPIHPSSSYHGYDVNDYYDVRSDYGSMADFESMLATLKQKGIEVIIDMVLNHSGINNPWFTQAVEDYKDDNINPDSKKDWYSFSETGGAGYSQYRGVYYECNFSSSMPEFNFDCSAWRDEVEKIFKFWLRKGVAGFRLDAVLYYYYNNDALNGDVCEFFRDCVSDEFPDCYFVGEGWTNNNNLLKNFFPSKMGTFFDFDRSFAGKNLFGGTAKGMNEGKDFTDSIQNAVTAIQEACPTSYPSFFISNHDTDRPSESLYKDEWLKTAASLIYLMPGTPYIYYGEEINLFGVRGNEQTDGMRRLPMVWKNENDEYRCNVPDPQVRSLAKEVVWAEHGATDLEAVPKSTVNHYKKVGNVRNRLKGIVNATIESVDSGERDVVDYILNAEKRYQILTNVGDSAKTVEMKDGTLFDSIDTSSVAPKIEGKQVTIAPYSTVVIELA